MRFNAGGFHVDCARINQVSDRCVTPITDIEALTPKWNTFGTTLDWSMSRQTLRSQSFGYSRAGSGMDEGEQVLPSPSCQRDVLVGRPRTSQFTSARRYAAFAAPRYGRAQTQQLISLK